MKNLFLIVIILLLFTACPEDMGDSITVYNESNQNISFYLGQGLGGTIFPDTTLPLFKVGVKVEAGKFLVNYYYLRETYEREHTDTLCLFILSVDTVEKYSWDKIHEEYMILRRYDLSFQDFKRLNYTIHYPPTENMKNIKMYPPYGSNP